MMALDLLSTSQRFGLEKLSPESEQIKGKCIYNAPLICWQVEGKTYHVSQANCHHWDCPKCGIGRAKEEYWRIVQGSISLHEQGHALWFITITTRGAGLSVAEAEQSYLHWTNRLFSRIRGQATRKGLYWCSVQVTERQKRKHPHSHILTTYHPGDEIEGCVEKWETVGGQRRSYWKDALRSDYLQEAVCSSGLGEQYDISRVKSPAAVSRYIGKYLFKQTLHNEWPKGWKRVRYSQNWPKQQDTEGRGFPLLTSEDWYRLSKEAVIVRTADRDTFEYVQWRLFESDCIVREPKQ